eukprot:2806476-Pyramimonas_sp.AAC.1
MLPSVAEDLAGASPDVSDIVGADDVLNMGAEKSWKLQEHTRFEKFYRLFSAPCVPRELLASCVGMAPC